MHDLPACMKFAGKSITEKNIIIILVAKYEMKYLFTYDIDISSTFNQAPDCLSMAMFSSHHQGSFSILKIINATEPNE